MNTGSWTTSDVIHYLEQISLSQYSETFKKNDIDGPALLSLDEKKIKELGIQSIGHRIKLMRFINSIKSCKETGNLSNEVPNSKESQNKKDTDLEEQRSNKVDTDSIHPLNESVHYHIFVKPTENEDTNYSSLDFEVVECKICHQKIPITFFDHHEKSCQNVFHQCQREYRRRGINLTDSEIIDLINGKVPVHHVKLEKCQYCGRKFAPSTFSKHELQCKKKMSMIRPTLNEPMPSFLVNSNDFKKNHQQLIELIRARKKEKKNHIFSENSLPVVKLETTETF